MVHRRLLADDSRGVGEALKDDTQIRVTHYVVLNDTSGSSAMQRMLEHRIINQPVIMFGAPITDTSVWNKYYLKKYAPISSGIRYLKKKIFFFV